MRQKFELFKVLLTEGEVEKWAYCLVCAHSVLKKPDRRTISFLLHNFCSGCSLVAVNVLL